MPLSFFTKKTSSFSGNVVKLMSGETFAQALSILAAPIITRLFAPEAYGISALFLSISGIIGVIVCLRYELAIMLPQNNEEAANVLVVSLCSVFLITSLSILIIFWGGDCILRFMKAPELKTYLWIVPISVFIAGVSTSLNYWILRRKHFGRLSAIPIISSITTTTTKLSAGFAGFVSGGVLIVTTILGQLVAAATFVGAIWRDDKKLFINHVRWRAIVDGLSRYKKFPLFDTWSALLNTISWQLPALMLSSFFSISVVGFYALASTIIMKPLSIITLSLSSVFYQKACKEKNDTGKIGELVENLIDKLMFISILPIVVLAMVSEELFMVVFGGRWIEAGRYAQILAPWVFFWFISSPLNNIFTVYERQGSALLMNTIIFLTRLCSLFIGGIYNNIYLALGLFSATGIITYALYAGWNIKLAHANARRILLFFFKYSIYSFPVFLCLYLVKYELHLGTSIVLLSALLMMTLYLIIFRNKITSLLKYKNFHTPEIKITATNNKRLDDENICNNKLCSVIVPVHNRQEYVSDALNSVWNQTYRPLELIIVDDGSTESSPEVVSEWISNHQNDPSLRIIYHRQANQGAPVARNNGLLLSNGEFVQFLDDDDIMYPEKIEKQVSYLMNHPEIDIVACNLDYLNEKLQFVTRSNIRAPFENEPAHHYILQQDIMTFAPIHRKETLFSVGGWTVGVPSGQDNVLHAKLAIEGAQFAVISDVLAGVRCHSKNRLVTSVNFSRSAKHLNDDIHNYTHIIKKAKIVNKADSMFLNLIASRLRNSARVYLSKGMPKRASNCLSFARQLSPESIKLSDRFYESIMGKYIGVLIEYFIVHTSRILKFIFN